MSTDAPSAVPAPRRGRFRRWLLPFGLAVLFISLLVNLGFILYYFRIIPIPLGSEPTSLEERVFLGDEDAREKIAVVRVSGVISEAGIQYPIRQLELAAKDPRVKAVVLRVDSPGGTVWASQELYENILNVRDNTGRRFSSTGPKPVSVSMGALAASGGYYISAAGKPVAAESTTITGSIGVFAALPNVAGWTKEHGIHLELVKAGKIKASGSFFHSLSPEERETWQDTVDNAYDIFLKVIAANRPALTSEVLREKMVVDRMSDKRDEKGNPVLEPNGTPVRFRYTRTLADGGTFTAADAKRFGLIDEVSDLPAMIRSAAASAGLSRYKAVIYDRPTPLFERLTGIQVQRQQPVPDFIELSARLTPRLWYLAPSADAGLLTP